MQWVVSERCVVRRERLGPAKGTRQQVDQFNRAR